MYIRLLVLHCDHGESVGGVKRQIAKVTTKNLL
jgi:hypothetical protein